MSRQMRGASLGLTGVDGLGDGLSKFNHVLAAGRRWRGRHVQSDEDLSLWLVGDPTLQTPQRSVLWTCVSVMRFFAFGW